MSDTTGSADERDEFEIDRRKLLQPVGSAGVGLAVTTGVASAHSFQFFGCSQVCSDTDGNLAVVATDDGYECRTIDTTSERSNVLWGWTSHCYEVTEGEAVVGVLKEEVWRGDRQDPGGACTLCLNPNNCASNHYDSEAEIKADLDTDSGRGACVGNIKSGHCTVYGSNGGASGGGNGGGRGPPPVRTDDEDNENDEGNHGPPGG